jgi:hypothetical protein
VVTSADFVIDQRAPSARTRAELDSEPTDPNLLEDLERITVEAAQASVTRRP